MHHALRHMCDSTCIHIHTLTYRFTHTSYLHKAKRPSHHHARAPVHPDGHAKRDSDQEAYRSRGDHGGCVLVFGGVNALYGMSWQHA
jgi:hypothetical protein